jgi:uncharacterized protein
MKNAIILHGTGCTPNSYWIPWLTEQLESNGYIVFAPQLPDAERPTLSAWLPAVLRRATFGAETIIIGHSAGAPLTLSVLESIHIPIAKAILVAGYARSKGKEKKSEPILQEQYDWKKIRSNARAFIFINSDNDPWGCDDAEGRYLLDHLGGTQIILHGEGHMGSDAYHQPYKKFPLLAKLIEL